MTTTIFASFAGGAGMNDYYTESQVNRIEQDAYDGAILEAGKEWERQRDEFNSREHELESRIAELEEFIDKLIKAGNALESQAYVAWRKYGMLDFPAAETWCALVKDWKERAK